MVTNIDKEHLLEDHDSVVKHALEGLNRIRAALAAKPIADFPKGKRRRSCECVVARGLREGIDQPSIRVVEKAKTAVASEPAFELRGLSKRQAERLAEFGNVLEIGERCGDPKEFGYGIELGPILRRFIKLFDAGFLPEYDVDLNAVGEQG